MPRIDWYTFSISRRLLFVVAGVSSLSWAGVALAAPMSISVPLTGAEQVPPVLTAGKGTAELTYDPDTRIVTWTWSPSVTSLARLRWPIFTSRRWPARTAR